MSGERGRAGRGTRPRRPFTITPAGRAAFAAWLRQPPEPEGVRNELLLKAFFSRSLPTPLLRSHIEAFYVRQQALADYFARGAREAASLEDPSRRRAWTLTVRAGQLVADARIRWAEEALAALRDEDLRPTPRKASARRRKSGSRS